jgi:hypothetical protein
MNENGLLLIIIFIKAKDMVNISKTIANKIQEKRSDLTSDEVKTFSNSFFFVSEIFVLDNSFSILFTQSWY